MGREDYRPPLPSSPFTRTREFVGVFEAGAKTSKPFSIEIAYSSANSHVPKGVVRGNSDDFEALERFYLTTRAAVFTLRSISAERDPIVCRDVLFRRFSNRHFPKDEKSTIHQVIGRFSAHEYRSTRTLGGSRSAPQEVQFILAGPTTLWMTRQWRRHLPDGNVTIELGENVLALDATPYQVSAQPYYTYGAYLGKERDPDVVGEAELYALTVRNTGEARDKEAFTADAATLAEALCLLVSFVSKTTVTWFSTIYTDSTTHEETYFAKDVELADEPDFNELVLELSEIRSFLNIALTAYTQRKVELQLPILHYVLAQSVRYENDRFTLLFFAFEKLISSLEEQNPEPDLLTDKELSSIWKLMTPALEAMGKTEEQIGLIRDKRAELQRIPLKHKEIRHLGLLGVEFADIGGEAGLGKMNRVRNLLTHDHGEVPIRDIAFETSRLETLVERMLLKMLGWQGRDKTPTLANRWVEKE